MWMARRLTADSDSLQEAQLGRVTSNNGFMTIQGETESRGLLTAAPWGVYSLPPKGTLALVFPRLGTCAGVVTDASQIAAGEVLLKSLGGAEILLKNNGEVVINGQVFPAKEGD